MQALFKDLLKSAIITDILGKMPAVKLIFFTMLGMMLLSFLFLSLLSHNSLDPAWSHLGSTDAISNVMGGLGAWVSDILYVFFGLGAWWLAVLLCYELICIWSKQVAVAWWLRVFAYGFLLIFISGLLAQWGSYTNSVNAMNMGGVIGFELHQGLQAIMGQLPATLFLCALILVVGFLTFDTSAKKLTKLPTKKSSQVISTSEPKLFEPILTTSAKHTAKSESSEKSLNEFLNQSGLRDEVLNQHIKEQNKAKQNKTTSSEPINHEIEGASIQDASKYSDTKGTQVTYVPTEVKIWHDDDIIIYPPNQNPASKVAPEAVSDKNLNDDTVKNILIKDNTGLDGLDVINQQQFKDDLTKNNFPTNTDDLISDNFIQETLTSVVIESSTAENDVIDNHVDNGQLMDHSSNTNANTAAQITPSKPDITSEHAGKSYAMSTLEYRMNLSPIPELSLLDETPPKQVVYTSEELAALSELLEIKLKEFGVSARVISSLVGPVVTRFEVELAAGVKVNRVTKISQDLARSMSMTSLRVIPVIAGKPYIGIEVPNRHRQIVSLIELLQTKDYQDPDSGISIAIGADISGKAVIADLAKAPHMLVAGTTGSGKSVLVNSFLLSMLLKYTPDELRLMLIDPKQLELANYADIPHLLTPVITDMTEATAALNWCVTEMERRYQLMSLLRVRKLSEFNKKVNEAEQTGQPIIDPLWNANDSVSITSAPKLKPLPQIVVVADEFADMMMQLGKTAEEPIVRLAQKARAAGIHLILATQRPVATVVTGLIKSNVPSRVALRVNSAVDSRIIIEESGAEDMLGHGDMMFLAPGKNTTERVHGAYVKDDEVNRITDAWRERGKPEYIDLSNSYVFEEENIASSSTVKNGDEEYYNQAMAFFMETRKVSISSLQRKLSIGYNKAARIVDLMEERGVVSPMDNSGKRQLLI